MTAATSPRSSPTPGTFAAGWHPSGSKNGSNKPAATVLQIPAGHAVPWHKPAPTTAKPSTRRVRPATPDWRPPEQAARTHSANAAHGPHATSEPPRRSEEHTSELQSLMRISYAVFCLKKKKTTNTNTQKHTT